MNYGFLQYDGFTWGPSYHKYLGMLHKIENQQILKCIAELQRKKVKSLGSRIEE